MPEPSVAAQTICQQGFAHYERRDYTKALACFVEARHLEPSYLDACWNECLTRLMLGEFEAGWLLHEGRWQKNEGRWEVDPAKRGWRHAPQPLWLGQESLAGKTILLWAEQGFGDALQFCRYALLVAQQAAQVVLYVRQSVARLLRHSFTEARIAVVAEDEPLPAFDFHCPLMSLPLACGTRSVELIPAPCPYVSAEPALVAQWHERLMHYPKASSKRIGLVWAGLLRSQNPLAIQMDAARSLDFSNYARLIEHCTASGMQVQWFSLQKDGELPLDSGVIDLTSELEDWSDTAALIANLDLVIACDTAVAHLAASMGKPTWIVSRYNGCWRWLGHRTDSPWYPTARLFHQTSPGDWHGVMSQLIEALDRK